MKYEIKSNILWLDDVPSFRFLPNGEKDPITPSGWIYYIENKEKIDEWLKNENMHNTGRH